MHSRMYSHRGVFDAQRDENTLASLRRAKTGFECDVRIALDNVPVVVHDTSLSRTHKSDVKVSNVDSMSLFALYNVPFLADVLVETDCPIVLDVKEKHEQIARWLSDTFTGERERVTLLFPREGIVTGWMQKRI